MRSVQFASMLFAATMTVACARGEGTGGDSLAAGAATAPRPDTAPLGDLTGEELTPADTGPSAYDPRSPAAIGFWRLAGNEPFWGVSADTGGITFRTPENPEGIRFPIAVPVLYGDTLRFDSVTPDAPGHEIEVVLVRKRCADSMSDKEWEYEARVTVDRKTYEGCGEKGSAPFVSGAAKRR